MPSIVKMVMKLSVLLLLSCIEPFEHAWHKNKTVHAAVCDDTYAPQEVEIENI